MSFLISSAHAQDSAGSAGGEFGMLIMLALFLFDFLFFFYIATAKRVKDIKTLFHRLPKVIEVLTQGGP